MIGLKLQHYDITKHRGSGRMGDVYQATDSTLGRSVAIKILPEAFARDTERIARLEREARVLASLNHPNIAAIFGYEQSGGQNFLVMEFVDGETLVERNDAGPIALDEAMGIARQILEALEAAHEKGVIHRDLKPANIKVTSDGKVKVLDVGLAKAIEREPANAQNVQLADAEHSCNQCGRDPGNRVVHVSRAGERTTGRSAEGRVRVRLPALRNDHWPSCV
jgi:serine/threonine-protein kinase